jgi:hypothetical protein
LIRKGTWIAVGAFALLLVAVVVFDRAEDEPPTTVNTPSPEPIWMVATDDITGIRVEDFLAETVLEVQRDAELLWEVLLPVPREADVARVERAVSWLAGPTPRSEIAMQDDLSIFGLIEPEYRVTVILQDGKTLGFDVGRKSPTGGSRYALYANRNAILLMRDFGLDEVLDLIVDLAPTATPAPEEGTPEPVSTDEN